MPLAIDMRNALAEGYAGLTDQHVLMNRCHVRFSFFNGIQELYWGMQVLFFSNVRDSHS